MSIAVKFLPDAVHDLKKLDNIDKEYILSAVEKLTSTDSQNLIVNGIGKSLDKSNNDLFYVKLAGMDIKIVYQLISYENDFIFIFVEFIKDNFKNNINL